MVVPYMWRDDYCLFATDEFDFNKPMSIGCPVHRPLMTWEPWMETTIHNMPQGRLMGETTHLEKRMAIIQVKW